jgi:hypothetical protein
MEAFSGILIRKGRWIHTVVGGDVWEVEKADWTHGGKPHAMILAGDEQKQKKREDAAAAGNVQGHGETGPHPDWTVRGGGPSGGFSTGTS